MKLFVFNWPAQEKNGRKKKLIKIIKKFINRSGLGFVFVVCVKTMLKCLNMPKKIVRVRSIPSH